MYKIGSAVKKQVPFFSHAEENTNKFKHMNKLDTNIGLLLHGTSKGSKYTTIDGFMNNQEIAINCSLISGMSPEVTQQVQYIDGK